MATMAEIEENYPERLAAFAAATGAMSFAEFTEGLSAGLERYRAALAGERLPSEAEAGERNAEYERYAYGTGIRL